MAEVLLEAMAGNVVELENLTPGEKRNGRGTLFHANTWNQNNSAEVTPRGAASITRQPGP